MNYLKTITLSLYGLYSLTTLAAQGHIEPPMVTIPAGTFIMGSNTGQPSKIPHFPEHEVSINAFQLSQFEVTVSEFRKFIEATHYKTGTNCWAWKADTGEIDMRPGSWNTPKYAPSEFHPVMCIGQTDAKAYIAWLNQQTGKQYRLPSESEWEYAARAGSTEDYFWGADNKNLCDYANIFDQSGTQAFKRDLNLEWTGVNCDDGAPYTTVVGMYKPNAFGLFDMIGNVGEYVEDCEHASYEGAPSDGSTWNTDCVIREFPFGKIEFIMQRGGSYVADEAWSRLFVRGHSGESNPSSLGEGFRLALNIDEMQPSPSKVADKTAEFQRMLIIAQNKQRQSAKPSVLGANTQP